MRHCRTDYEAIQPWPTKRPHLAKLSGETMEFPDEEAGIDLMARLNLLREAQPLIPDDEPVFIIRAMDEVGPSTVRAWAEYARAHGANQELCDRVLRWAGEMAAYAELHGGPKVPDTPADLLRP